jgi:hypothetical protein
VTSPNAAAAMPSSTRIAAVLGGLAHQFFSLLLPLLVEARFGAGRIARAAYWAGS